ncbi:hypothetical protein IGI04_024488 [Brassica rapa subsp. trilocularis]|uniref:Uncharacterized protein n=1 Tax=Brassica rapa subsp. trilocularis TaxID=1813537 RepID=A0ABQ7M9C7_BRACM|nr:hypothetical protein IGI04_024488 [Brassica rapa subsp. trilocularis]
MSSTQIKEKRWASYPNSSKWADTGLTIFHLVKTQLSFRPKVFAFVILVGIISQLSFAGLRRFLFSRTFIE